MGIIRDLFFLDLNKIFAKIKNKNQDWDIENLSKFDKIINNLNLSDILYNLDYDDKRKFIFRLIYFLKMNITLTVGLLLLRVVSGISTIFALNYFIESLLKPDHILQLIISAVVLPLIVFINGISTSHYFFSSFKIKAIIKYILINSIFKNIETHQKNNYSEGRLLSHISQDSETISIFPVVVFEFCHDILLIVGGVIALYSFLGIAATVPLIILFLLVPISKIIAKKISANENFIFSKQDQRMMHISSVFSQMKNIKALQLEKYIQNTTNDIRTSEIKYCKKRAKYISYISLIYASSQAIICASAFGAYVFLGYNLSLPLVFTCLSIFKIIESPIGDASGYIAQLAASRISLRRIFSFFSEKKDKNENNFDPIENLKIIPGESIAIIGSIGSGKSHLLKRIFNKIKENNDTIFNSNNIILLEQTPWILNTTIRNNILLDDSNRDISEAFHFTSLKKDILSLPKNELFLCGENGCNLSGGQKQRIALARAFVAEKEVLLLDDPFSALDKDTEKFIFNELIFNKWADKTRIIVSHRLDHLMLFNKIILLSDRNIAAQGNFYDLINHSKEFQSFYNTSSHSKKQIKVENINNNPQQEDNNYDLENLNAKNNDAQNIEKERYYSYIKLLSENKSLFGKTSFLLLFLTVIAALFPRLQDFWLSFWSSSKIHIFGTDFSNTFSQNNNLTIYIIFGLLSAFSSAIHCFIFSIFGISASEKLHSRSFSNIIKAPMSYFDNHETGKMLNIFSHDTKQLDTVLPDYFRKLILVLVEIILIFLAIIFIEPLALLVIIPIYFIQRKIQFFYIKSTIEINWKIAIPKSKILNFFTRISQRFFYFNFFK